MLKELNQKNVQCQERKIQKADIFDELMMIPALRRFYPLYKNYRESILYLFFGGITFFLSLGLFVGMDYFTNINELINNVICWVICVVFQFITNKTWVFDGKADGTRSLLRQMVVFFGGRVFTLMLEEAIIVIFITWLSFNSFVVKFSAQIIVIILNYVISKTIVFRNR